jgi:hypothetical protein
MLIHDDSMTTISTLSVISLIVSQDRLAPVLGDFEVMGKLSTSDAESAIDELLKPN